MTQDSCRAGWSISTARVPGMTSGRDIDRKETSDAWVDLEESMGNIVSVFMPSSIMLCVADLMLMWQSRPCSMLCRPSDMIVRNERLWSKLGLIFKT